MVAAKVPELFTVADVAKMYDVSKATVFRAIKDGTLVASKPGGSWQWFVSKSDLPRNWEKVQNTQSVRRERGEIAKAGQPMLKAVKSKTAKQVTEDRPGPRSTRESLHKITSDRKPERVVRQSAVVAETSRTRTATKTVARPSHKHAAR